MFWEKLLGQRPLSQQGKVQVSLAVRIDQMHGRKFGNFLELTDSLTQASWNREDRRNTGCGTSNASFFLLLLLPLLLFTPPSIWNYFLENNIGTSTHNIISVNCYKLNTPKQHTQIRKQHCMSDWPKSSTVMTAFYKLTSNMMPSMLGKCVAFQLT